MRFRRRGTNWEDRQWFTPPSLNAYMDEIEDAWPEGNSKYDGTVASRGHDLANPRSDHRPHPYTDSPGIVRATDAFVTPIQGARLFTALIESRDSRLKYAIYDHQIVASYKTSHRAAWVPGPYDGYNAHVGHLHLSVLSTMDYFSHPWNLNLSTIPTPPPIDPEEDTVFIDKARMIATITEAEVMGYIDAGVVEPDTPESRAYWKKVIQERNPANADWDSLIRAIARARYRR